MSSSSDQPSASANTAAKRLARMPHGGGAVTRPRVVAGRDTAAEVPAPLLDAESGRIGRVLLGIPGRGAETREGPLRRLLEALPHRAALDILVAPRALGQVSGWIDATGPGAVACLIQAREGHGFPIWMQDLALARADGSLAVLGDAEAGGLAETVRTVAEGAELRVRPAGVALAAGNVLAAGERLLIGADSLPEAGLEAGALGAILDPGRRPLVLGTAGPLPAEATRAASAIGAGWYETIRWRQGSGRRQPMPSLDLFVAPAGQAADGRARFLVGCPRRGAEALGRALAPHADADAFDEIAAALAADGAEVIRNPLPLVCRDDAARRRRIWYHLPVNNVLLEDDGRGGRTVYLPCFADPLCPELAEIDSMNAAVWAWLGYSVVRVPDMLALAQGFGGPRRVASVIART